jgi:hypothetical protein
LRKKPLSSTDSVYTNSQNALTPRTSRFDPELIEINRFLTNFPQAENSQQKMHRIEHQLFTVFLLDPDFLTAYPRKVLA